MDVKIYTSPTCQWCKKTKEFLKGHNIKYKEFNVREDQKAMHDMVEKSGQMGVPVINVDGKIIVGFDESELKKTLRID